MCYRRRRRRQTTPPAASGKSAGQTRQDRERDGKGGIEREREGEDGGDAKSVLSARLSTCRRRNVSRPSSESIIGAITVGYVDTLSRTVCNRNQATGRHQRLSVARPGSTTTNVAGRNLIETLSGENFRDRCNDRDLYFTVPARYRSARTGDRVISRRTIRARRASSVCSARSLPETTLLCKEDKCLPRQLSAGRW